MIISEGPIDITKCLIIAINGIDELLVIRSYLVMFSL